jgi:NADPH:quinone reductase-like Zn-dependent oxidoreductase
MRAVVYRGVNDLRVETVPVPRIQSDELLVRVAACGVCPTDIKKIQFGTVSPPRIFGHETAGTISQVGARLKGFRIGARADITSRALIVMRVAIAPCTARPNARASLLALSRREVTPNILSDAPNLWAS